MATRLIRINHWIDTNIYLPESGKNVLVFYKNSHGKSRIVKAFFADQDTIESDPEDEANDEYNEERDCYYLKEGWYECVDNWDEWSSIVITNGTVTHWTPLPEIPDV